MKIALQDGRGGVRFIHGTGETWSGLKKPDEFGVSVLTPQGAAGFIFDNDELVKFIASAQEHLKRNGGGRG